MLEDYTIFKKYPTLQLAQETEKLLNDAGIQTLVADNLPPVDITFSGSTLQNETEIRIHPTQFQKAQNILANHAKVAIEDVDSSYYLFEFSEDELYEILLKPDEWGEFDYALSQQLLKKRGKSIDQEQLDALKMKRLQELAQPDKNQLPWIIAGYIFAVLGGFLGLIIGYFLWKSKKTLPNGSKVYSYKASDRKHGLYIFLIGIIILPLVLMSRFIENFNWLAS